jgi:hypothetical protein
LTRTRCVFYQQFSSCLDSVATRDFLIVLGDMNARVGSDRDIWPGVIGPFGGNVTSGNGERLLSCCSGYNLSVMGTWFQHKDEHRYTWTHPSGLSHAQIDHILVRQFHRKDVLDVRVCRGADISVQGVGGHSLVLAKFRASLVKERKVKRPLQLCLGKLTLASVRDSYCKAVEESWSKVESYDVASVEAERRMFSTCIRDCAEKELGRSHIKAKNVWISAETLLLVERKRNLKRELMQAKGRGISRESSFVKHVVVRFPGFRD